MRHYLNDLYGKINSTQLIEIASSHWRSLTDSNQPQSYLPKIEKYINCLGSKPQFRGYPCGLWTLFHVLTVRQYEREPSMDGVREVIDGIRSFVAFFFGCKECSENFAIETKDYLNHLKGPRDAVIYLWRGFFFIFFLFFFPFF